jgi:pimeloyl-ACP methyl ester carboxylesterase
MKFFFADDGEKIHFQTSGEGQPILMLHGWTASHLEWLPFLDCLTQKHRVIRWDARGHGGHPLTHDTVPNIQRMAHDLHNLLEHFDLYEITVVGHSMGALTLWQYMGEYGCNRIGKVCLIDQSPKLVTDNNWSNGIYGDFDAGRSAAFLSELEHDFAESVLRLTAHGLNERAREQYDAGSRGWKRERQRLKGLEPGPLIACWKSLAEADYREVLGEISIPALLIYGGVSNFYSNATAHYVNDKIAGSVLHIYENTDHSPHQWQRERFAHDLLAFIATN